MSSRQRTETPGSMNDFSKKCALITQEDDDPMRSNNNDVYFESDYNLKSSNQEDLNGLKSSLESGRASGLDRESAFSSTCDEISSEESGSQPDSSSVYQNYSSGRSSASNQEPISDHENPESNSEFEDIAELLAECPMLSAVNDVRVRFLASLESNDRSLYDDSDLHELSNAMAKGQQSLAIRLISRYFDSKLLPSREDDDGECHHGTDRIQSSDDAKKTVDSLREFLKFRHRFQLPKTRPLEFSREFYILNGIFAFGHDKQNLPVLYVSAHVHRKWSTKLDHWFRRYVAWHLDYLTGSSNLITDEERVSKEMNFPRRDKSGSFVLCFDCDRISYASLDMDFLKFLVQLLLNYYPNFCRYCLIKDNPWVFRSIWSLVKTWLPEEARNNVHLISAKQLTDYIDLDQVPNCMKVNDFTPKDKSTSGRFNYPTDWDSIRDIESWASEMGLSQDEVRKFKSHVEKTKKDYEKLGAM